MFRWSVTVRSIASLRWKTSTLNCSLSCCIRFFFFFDGGGLSLSCLDVRSAEVCAAEVCAAIYAVALLARALPAFKMSFSTVYMFPMSAVVLPRADV